MKVFVIEDEGAARRRLEGIVQAHPELTLEGSAASGAEAIQLINSKEADLLLMDIELKDMTAFEVLKSTKTDFSGRIIFVTAYNEFAIKAFEVFAIDYVLKPYTDERILGAIDRCRQSKGGAAGGEVYAILESLHFPGKICIPEGRTSHFFEKEEIGWIEADGYHSIVHTTDGKEHLIRILLKDLNRLLPGDFLRINRSVIINKSHVVSMKDERSETTFRLKGGKELFGKKGYLG